MISPASSLSFPNGSRMPNRFMLAPMTNTQSHADGTLSEEEFHWLTMRAKGGFGMVMTCAAHVQAIGQGFPGQLGIFGDQHLDGHRRLAQAIQSHGSLAVVQLHHAGMRSPKELIGETPVSASDVPKYGARGLTLKEVEELKEAFLQAALRAQKAGYDGIEIHGAHGYILTQFLSAQHNQRVDQYGGSLDNRARLLFEILEGVREQCGSSFLLGVRLSPERFGMQLEEIKTLIQMLVHQQMVDFIDLSLWDCFKSAEEFPEDPRSLLDHFTEIDFGSIPFTVAGKIQTGKDVQRVLDSGVDFVCIGRSAVLHHDFPKKVLDNPAFEPQSLPVSPEYLAKEGLSSKFISYMGRWPEFVSSND